MFRSHRLRLVLLLAIASASAGCAAETAPDQDVASDDAEIVSGQNVRASEKLLAEATDLAEQREAGACITEDAILEKLYEARKLRSTNRFARKIAASVALQRAVGRNLGWYEVTGRLRSSPTRGYTGLEDAFTRGVTFWGPSEGMFAHVSKIRFESGNAIVSRLDPSGEWSDAEPQPVRIDESSGLVQIGERGSYRLVPETFRPFQVPYKLVDLLARDATFSPSESLACEGED